MYIKIKMKKCAVTLRSSRKLPKITENCRQWSFKLKTKCMPK
jgi:hypothetical protein